MAVWLVRAGRYGQNEDFAIDRGRAVIGWDGLPDLSEVDTREKLTELMREAYPDASNYKLGNYVGQVWAFKSRIQPKEDLVVLPLKTRSVIAIGRPTGPYEYCAENPEGARHTRPVEWIRTDIPRTAFDQDILYSLGAFMTVCQIRRNKAEERIKAVLEGREQLPPGATEETSDEEAGPVAGIDIEELAGDQIRTFISQKFRGHELARLVGLVLQAQGYQTRISPAGPDGGVDVIAGRGPMGFDPPRLCVEVKSSDSPVDVGVLRELQGVMRNFGAEQGLLVSWGGFKQSVLKEARQLFFEIRLWDAGDLVKVLLEHYDRLTDELQAELPLKRIWTLVQEED